MRRFGLVIFAVVVSVVGGSAMAALQQGPLTPAPNLMLRADSNAYLLATTVGAGSGQGPLTPWGNLRLTSDANGYLNINCVAGCSGSGSGNAPSDAQYWVGAASSGLSAEKDLSALATALVINTAGVPSAYAGVSCTNQFLRALSAVAASTCATVSLTADVSGDLPLSSLAQFNALTIAGNATNATADLAGIAISDGQTLKRVGTALTSAKFGQTSTSLLTSGTAQTYTVPSGVYAIRVRMCGGGGGGGGGDQDATNAGAGGGGNAGSYLEKLYATTPGATFRYSIGAAGTGGTGNSAGTDGGSTQFDELGTTIIATGGAAGQSMAAGTTFAVTLVNSNAATTGGDLSIEGARGNRGFRSSTTAGVGGQSASSLLGGAVPGGFNSTGQTGTGYCSGGGGTYAAQNTSDRAGGTGGAGVIVVEEYN